MEFRYENVFTQAFEVIVYFLAIIFVKMNIYQMADLKEWEEKMKKDVSP